MSSEEILIRPLSTEKVLFKIERENIIVFVVNRKATKNQIRREIERLFNVKVEKVNTHITPRGEKVAYIKLKPEYSASEVATKLGIL